MIRNSPSQFDFKRERVSYELNAPYSAERRKAASELAKKNIQNLQQSKKRLNAARRRNGSLQTTFWFWYSCFYEIILNIRACYAIMKENSTTTGDFVMPVSYDRLWKMLIDKKMNRTDLKESSGISFNVLAKMGKNEFISMESLMKICTTLKCNIGDIVDFFPESEELQK